MTAAIESVFLMWLAAPSFARLSPLQIQSDPLLIQREVLPQLVITYKVEFKQDLSSYSPTGHTYLHVSFHGLMLPDLVYPCKPSLRYQPT